MFLSFQYVHSPLAISTLALLAPEISIPEQDMRLVAQVAAASGGKTDSDFWVQSPSLSLLLLASEAYAKPQPGVGSNQRFFSSFFHGWESLVYARSVDGNGLPFPPPGDLPNPGIVAMCPVSPASAGGCLTTEPPGSPCSGAIFEEVNGTLFS